MLEIDYKQLVIILMKTDRDLNDTSPLQALYIKFENNQLPAKDTITYHTADGGLLVIDVNEKGEVLGIEIV